MSASQARLLTLTARLSDLELQAQQISNSKIRLSQQTASAAADYNAALSKPTLEVQAANLDAKGNISYIPATAANLTGSNLANYGKTMGAQMLLEDSAGRIVVSQKEVDSFTGAADATAFCVAMGITVPTDPQNAQKVQYYTNIFDMMAKGYNLQNDTNLGSSDWLYAQLTSGGMTLAEQSSQDLDNDGKKDWQAVSFSSEQNMKQETDDGQIAKAEAKYDAATSAIQVKDKTFDLELQQINTEHNAIQTEIETVQKVISKNIERSFKIFNG